jgi:hypothetical protein
MKAGTLCLRVLASNLLKLSNTQIFPRLVLTIPGCHLALYENGMGPRPIIGY